MQSQESKVVGESRMARQGIKPNKLTEWRSAVHVYAGTPTQPGAKLAVLYFGNAPTAEAATAGFYAAQAALGAWLAGDPVADHPLPRILNSMRHALGVLHVTRIGFEQTPKEN
jgi:hypothetical protein